MAADFAALKDQVPPKRKSFSRSMTEDSDFDDNLIKKIHTFFEKPASAAI